MNTQKDLGMDSPFFINITLAFLEGLVLIVSPCILPLLPVLLAGSVEGNKRHPLGVITGFILAFAILSFFAKQIIQSFNIDLSIIRIISLGLLSLFGIIMLSTVLSEKFSLITQRFFPSTLSVKLDTEKGFFGGLFFGSLLGLVWTPCAGPILAAVIVQTVIGNTTLSSFLILLAFGIGVSIPLLLVTFGARSLLKNLTFFKKNSDLIRKLLGVLILIGVVLMIYADKIIFWFSMPLNITPTNISTPATDTEVTAGRELNSSQHSPVLIKSKTSGLMHALMKPYPAPPLADIQYWINTKPIEISELKGKVILLDFWDYSCINCIRTLPYLKSWYQKYKDHGFVILGVHTPEFQFEQKLENVKNAVRDYGIEYPVLLDNLYSTWRNYQNQYWPASYLIDQKGQVVYTHFGEGNYEITEANIRTLLDLPEEETEKGFKIDAKENSPQQLFKEMEQTPEIYLGYERSQGFSSADALTLFYNKPNIYHYPENLKQNQWALSGSWSIYQKYIVAEQANDAIQLHFYASRVFAVMGSNTTRPILVKVLLNGKPLKTGSGVFEQGKDINNSEFLVDSYRLYDILHLEKPIGAKLELIITEPGVELYTFTFGSE